MLSDCILSMKKVIELDPQFSDALVTLAVAYDKLGQDEEAEFFYRKAVKLRPTDPNALNNLAVFLANCGRLSSTC